MTGKLGDRRCLFDHDLKSHSSLSKVHSTITCCLSQCYTYTASICQFKNVFDIDINMSECTITCHQGRKRGWLSL